MKVLRATRSHVPMALEILEKGGIILIPTETVYGLAVDGESEEAISNLRRVKGNDEGKMLQRLAANIEDVHMRVATWDPRIKRMASAFWPGPLTLILENVGWRVPDHPFLRDLIRRFGRPLAASSANLSAREPALDCDEAVRTFEGKIDLALDGGRASLGKASSVVRVAGSQLEILREGAISRAQLLKCWEGDTEAA